MAVQFILGRSGTGKTSHCISSIVRAISEKPTHSPIVLLVPEQATYQAERAILADPEISGYSDLQILSFERLQFLLLGRNFAHSEISKLGQQIIVHKILNSCKDQLKVFTDTAHTPGLAEKLTAAIVELHQCAKTPQDTHQFVDDLKADQPDSITAMKFADIATIYEKYLEFLADKFVNPNSQLTEAIKLVPCEIFSKETTLYVDGFASFTIQQRDMLAQLIKTARDSHIALCLDPSKINLKDPAAEPLDPTSMFSVTEQTYIDIVHMAGKLKLKIIEPVLLNTAHRFNSAAPLAHVEANLFNYANSARISAGDCIQIAPAPNARAEINYIARQIIRLVRQKNYRFRDIAVIVSDIAIYQHYIEAAFSDYEIDYFLDSPKPMQHHPVVEFIISALSAAVNGFASSDIFAFLKTGLTEINHDHINQLENYCLAFGIDTASWFSQADWNFTSDDDKHFDQKLVNSIRKKALYPLNKLRKSLSVSDDTAITVEQFTKAIFDLLGDLNVQAKLTKWIEADPVNAGPQHQQFFDKLVDIFDELTDTFASDLAMPSEFFTILSNAFAKLTLKLIPQTLDQVLVGTIDRSRHPELKAVFLVGTTQKLFPTAVHHDSILTDADRAAATERDFALAETLTDQLTARQYLAYIAFTRPSEHLFITYPRTDDRGKTTAPSSFLSNLESLFTDLGATSAVARKLSDITTPSSLADFLCAALSRDANSIAYETKTLLSLVDSLAVDTDLQLAKIATLVRGAIDYNNNAVLDDNILGDLFTDPLTISTSRLSTFASCPFKYFAQYTLALKERKLAGFEPIDLGNFYHTILDRISKQLLAENKNFATVTVQYLHELSSQKIAEFLEEDKSLAHFKQRSHHNTFIINSAADCLADCLTDYSRLAKTSAFSLAASEFEFGPDKENRCSITLADGRTLNLTGMIDRIDIANIDGRNVVLLYDYKRSKRTVKWEKICHGLDIQLPVYMLAVQDVSINEIKVDDIAGAFFIPIESPPPSSSLDNIELAAEKYSRKAYGIFDGQFCDSLDTNASSGWDQYYNFFIGKDGPYGHFDKSAAMKSDQFETLLDFVRDRIAQISQRIFSGDIDIHPARIKAALPCDYCDYRSLCRFDLQVNEYNDLQPTGKQQLIDMAGGTDAD